MKHISKFVDTNLIDAEIKRLDDLRQELKRKNAVLRTRICRLKKVVQGINSVADSDWSDQHGNDWIMGYYPIDFNWFFVVFGLNPWCWCQSAQLHQVVWLCEPPL